MYHATLFLYRLYLVLFRKRRRIFGRNFIPASGPLIVVANHVGDDDPWVVSDLFPTSRVIHWWAKKELFQVHARMRDYIRLKERSRPMAFLLAVGTKFVVQHAQTIPVDRENLQARMNKVALARSRELLEEGGIIGIFGEGGVGMVGEAKPIFVKLAMKYQVPILPIRLTSADVVVGEPIFLYDLPPEERSADSEKIAREIMDKIYHLSPVQA